MTLTSADLQAIKKVLKPDFDNLEKKLTGKIDRFRQENRKDHNLIIKVFDERDHELRKRVERLESHAGLPTFKSL